MSKQKSALMTEGKIWKSILFFSIPLILGNLLQQMYNTVDSIIVGNYIGNDALAAVSSSTSLINLLIAFGQGAAVGAGVIVSQFLGAEKRDNVQSAIHTALALAIVLGLILTAIGVVFTPFFLKYMKTPPEVLEQSILYLRIYSCGFLFNIIYNMTAGILNAVGNSKRSLFYLAIASFTNIILDFILIRLCHMGVEGAAIATDVSQALSGLLAILFLRKVPTAYQLHLKKIRFHKDMLLRIIKIGLPSGIQNMVISFSNVLVQSSVNTFGTKAMAGFGAYLKIDGFNILPVLSFSMAVTTFTGQNFGAGKLDRVKKGMYVTTLMSFLYTAITGSLIFLFAQPMITLFTQDKAAISYGVLAVSYFCPYYFLIGILYALAGTVRGVGKSVPPMVVLLLSFCVFRIFWITLVLPHFDTIRGIYLLYPVSWTIGVTMMTLYTWKGKWLHLSANIK